MHHAAGWPIQVYLKIGQNDAGYRATYTTESSVSEDEALEGAHGEYKVRKHFKIILE